MKRTFAKHKVTTFGARHLTAGFSMPSYRVYSERDKRITGSIMALEEDRQIAAIAAEWGVDADLFEDADWELETIDGNDGEVYGYTVRFDEETDPAILTRLGITQGEFARELSLNAFDQPDSDEKYEPYSARRQIRPTGAGFANAALTLDSSDLILPLSKRVAPETDKKRAYYIDDERLTPSRFKRLGKRRKIQAMVQWFHEQYEDPALRTPYESAEGGYQWVFGGPFDAFEEISGQFFDVADIGAIRTAVRTVEKDGLVEWAPKENPDDYDEIREVEDEQPANSSLGVTASNFNGSNFSNFAFAEARPKTERPPRRTPRSRSDRQRVPVSKSQETRLFVLSTAEFLWSIERAEDALQIYEDNLPPRSHNNPPGLVEPDPIAPADFKLAKEGVAELKLDTQQANLTPEKLEAKASLFRRVAGSIAAWLGRKLDVAVDATIQTGIPIGIGWLALYAEEVKVALRALAEKATEWAHFLIATLP